MKLRRKQMNTSPFSFRASAKVKDAAAKLMKKGLIDDNFWMYNVFLQIDVIRDKKGRIDLDKSIVLNYMYRKYRCEIMKFSELFWGKTPTKLDLENLATVNAALLKNLSHEWTNFGAGKTEYVYSAN